MLRGFARKIEVLYKHVNVRSTKISDRIRSYVINILFTGKKSYLMTTKHSIAVWLHAVYSVYAQTCVRRVVTRDSKDVDTLFIPAKIFDDRGRENAIDILTVISFSGLIGVAFRARLRFRSWKMYVPSRFGVGPPTTHAGGDDTGNVPKLQTASEFAGRRSGTTRTFENAGTCR